MTSKGAGVREIVLLTLGWEPLPKSVSVEGAPADDRVVCPVPGILLVCDGGGLLLDPGFNTALIRDAALRRRFYGDPPYSVVLPGPGEPLEEALAFAGILVEDVKAVGLSHLHVDHTGGLRHFTGVPVHCQRRELEYGLSGHPDPEHNAIFRIDFDDPRHDWWLADGDVEIAPGVTAISTPGHTPGHQSFVVDLDESVGGGGFVFAFDAADLQENIDDEKPVGGTIGVSPQETLEPLLRLKAIAREKGYRMIPGHDPD